MRRVKKRSGAWGFQISRDPRKTFKEGEEHGNVQRGRNSHGDVRHGRAGQRGAEREQFQDLLLSRSVAVVTW